MTIVLMAWRKDRQQQIQQQIPPLRCGMTSKENRQRQEQRQIPPLRCGMTNKETDNGKSNSRFLRCAAE
jgi:hypothetical protein